MTIRKEQDEITFSIWKGFDGYSTDTFRSDCMAALSVALLSVPLSMAYALAAGLPLVVGIFATIFGTIFAAALGSSSHLIVGPTNTIAILIQAGISQIIYTYYREVTFAQQQVLAVNIMIELTLVVGLIQFLAGIFKLGKLTQFVSRSVIVGYVIGASFAIITAQAFAFVGLTIIDQPMSMYGKIDFFISHIQEANMLTLGIGSASLVCLFLFTKLSRRFPSAVLMLALSAFAVIFFNLEEEIVIVKDFGEVSSISPHIASPFLNLQIMGTLLPIAFAIALLGILEATMISRTIASKTGQFLAMNQEIFALGVTNFSVAFLGAMPCSGSFARSALNYSSGARTRLAAILSGLFVAIIFIVFKPIVLHIPLASLAALLLLSAIRMINWQELKLCLKATAADAFVLIITALSCILFNIEIGFYIGVMLSIVCYLKQAAKPQFVECTIGEEGEMRILSHLEEAKQPKVRILQVEGELFFAAADLLQTSVKAIAQDPRVRVIVLHMSGAYHIDATACVVLQHLNSYLKQSNRHLIVSGLSRSIWQVLCDSGLAAEIGVENLFIVNHKEPNRAIERALISAQDKTLEFVS